jgi:ABC-2 type transport system permease protein
VLVTFARNSLVREMSFRGNFLLQSVAAMMWTVMNLLFYILIFEFTDEIGKDTGWAKFPFFIFLATTMMVNSLMQTFVMPNAQEFSELIRTGRLDFAMCKPIDTQFLISLHRLNWSSLSNFIFGACLMIWSLTRLEEAPNLVQIALYPLYVLCGVGILYSVMITLAAASVWMVRNQSLADFFFYITTFSRYPMEIYRGPLGWPLQWFFTFLFPILIAINVPARLMAKPLQPAEWYLTLFAVFATAACLTISRGVFKAALKRYRSASS